MWTLAQQGAANASGVFSLIESYWELLLILGAIITGAVKLRVDVASTKAQLTKLDRRLFGDTDGPGVLQLLQMDVTRLIEFMARGEERLSNHADRIRDLEIGRASSGN